MDKLRRLATVYIATLTLAALVVAVGSLLRWEPASPHRLMVAGAFTLFVAAALLFPLPFAPKTKMTLDTGVLFASVLLFPPLIALLVAVIGTLLAAAVRRPLAVAVLFNSAQRVLQAGVGGLMLTTVDWDLDRLGVSSVQQVLMVGTVAATMYLINTLSVATIVALQSSQSPFKVWRESSWSVGLEYVSQLALGIMAAAVVDVHAWALPLLLLPAFAIYRSLERHAQLRETAEAVLCSTEASLAAAQRIAHLGSWNRDLLQGEETWSDEVFRVLGYAPQEFEPSYKAFLRAVHPEDRPLVEQATREAALVGKPYSIVHRIVLPSGEERIVQQQAETFFDASGTPVRAMGTMQDITERRAAEMQRDALLTEVEQALEFRNQFLSITSHELKTPITLLKGYAQVLHERLAQRGETDALRPLQVINRQADRMTALINELLDVSRLQSGRIKFTLQQVDLQAALQEVVSEVAEGTPEARITLSGETAPLWVSGDKMRLQQVMTNLLTNAVKYSSKGQEVRVRVERMDANAVVSVTDRGIGIPAEQQARVFDLYYRSANAQAGDADGLGLGLYISKMIVERHGGDITVESALGRGSTFRFCLPLLDAELRGSDGSVLEELALT